MNSQNLDKPLTLEERVNRLLSLAQLMIVELEHIKNVTDSAKKVIDNTTGIPASRLSSEDIDLEIIVKQASIGDKKQRLPTNPAPAIVANNTAHPGPAFVPKLFIGSTSVFITYLSPTTIDGGRGFIKANDSFLQYDEDANDVIVDQTRNWPSGFYRNKNSKETQLLVNINNGSTICLLDGLPSNSGSIKIFIRKFNLLFDNAIISNADTETREHLLMIYELIKSELNLIMTLHGF